MAGTTVKLRDIGEQLGLSVSTVSAVLNNRNTRHSPETRNRIIEMAQKLDYRPNYAARSLRTQRTHTIGIVAPILSLDLDDIEESCSSSGYTMSIGVFHNKLDRQKNRIVEFRQKYVDGLLIIHPLRNCPVIKELQNEGYPIVLVDVADNYKHVDTFMIDIKSSISMAMRHLFDFGHDRIGLITYLGESDYRRIREESWANQMLARGTSNYRDYYFPISKEKYPEADYILRSSYYTAKQITEKFSKNDPSRPTAVLAVADKVAIGAVRAFRESGWNVPEDISIVSAESSEYGRYCSVPLTSVDINERRCHNDALMHLISVIEGKCQERRPVNNNYDVKLRPGESAAPPASSVCD